MENREQEIGRFLETEYGLKIQGVKLLPSGLVNDSYLIKTTEGDYIARVSSDKDKELVQFEVDALHQVAGVGIDTPVPMCSQAGESVTLFENRPVILYPYIEGEMVKELSNDILRENGKFLANLHKSIAATAENGREVWDPEVLPNLYKDGRADLASIPHPEIELVLNFLDKHLADWNNVPDLPKGFTHQDLKPSNVLVRDGHLVGVVDFDNSFYGSYLYDLLTTVLWSAYKEGVMDGEAAQSVLSGYQSVRPLTKSEVDYMLDAMRFRLIREVFIGPHAAKNDKVMAIDRSLDFIEKYHNFIQRDSKTLEIIIKKLY